MFNMIRAILFLLIISSASWVALAQEQEQIPVEEEQPSQEIVDETIETDDTPDDQVEKDPDELGEEVPFQTQQAPEEPPVDGTSTTPEPLTNATTGEGTQPENSSVDPKNFTDTVLLQGLNKITARTSKLEVKRGDSIKFGNLKITLHACWKSPPEEDTENKALLEMWEEIPGEPRAKIFSGWMFSSSPLISAPEHPVYDVTVLSCENKAVAAIPDKEPEKRETKPAKAKSAH